MSGVPSQHRHTAPRSKVTDNSKPFRLIDLEDIEDEQPATEPIERVELAPPRRRLATEPVEKLDVNTATVEELEQLPGVGPLRARRIIAWRTRNGRFESLSDLTYVRGLGARSVMELTPYLRVAESDEIQRL